MLLIDLTPGGPGRGIRTLARRSGRLCPGKSQARRQSAGGGPLQDRTAGVRELDLRGAGVRADRAPHL